MAIRIKGALVVYPQEERHFSPGEMMLFQALADQATLAMAITQQLERQRDEATQEERNRLAREIHDTVAQSLAALVLQLEMAETFLSAGNYEQGPGAAGLRPHAVPDSAGGHASRRAGACGALSRTVLSRGRIDRGSAAVRRRHRHRNALYSFRGRAGVDRGAAYGPPAHRPGSAEQCKEILPGQRIRIGLQYGADSVALLVEDDGVGFDTSAVGAPDLTGGYGLFGMDERARLLGGEVQIDSTPGWGTRIRAVLPYRASRELAASLAYPPVAAIDTEFLQRGCSPQVG